MISITMVALSLAASQLGPRLIWNSIRDRQIKVVIGLFFATIIFEFVAIRCITATDVPDVAVTIATMPVGLCLFALLFYVHTIARSIIADTVIDEVALELRAAIEAMFEVGGGDQSRPPPGTVLPAIARPWRERLSPGGGMRSPAPDGRAAIAHGQGSGPAGPVPAGRRGP